MMSICSSGCRSMVAFGLMLILTAAAPAQQNAVDRILGAPTISVVVLDEAIAQTAAILEGLPKEQPGVREVDGKLKNELVRRLALLREGRKAVSARMELQQEVAGINAAAATERRKLDELSKRPASAVGEVITQEGLAAVEAGVRGLRERKQQLNEELRRSQSELEALPQRATQATERAQSAESAATSLAGARAKAQATEGAEAELTKIEFDNARLESRVARLIAEGAQYASEARKNLIPLIELRAQVVEEQINYEDQRLRRLQLTLKEKQEAELKNKERELAETKQEAEKAGTPSQHYLAEQRAELAQVETNTKRLETTKSEVMLELQDQEKALEANKESLSDLKALLELGAPARAARILQDTYERLRVQRRSLAMIPTDGLEEKVQAMRVRRFEVTETLFQLRQQRKESLKAVLAETPIAERDSLAKEAGVLQERLREALLAERSMLIDVLASARRLDVIPLERGRVLNELEALVLSKIFWIQDAPPINLALIDRATHELISTEQTNSMVNWSGRVFSGETLKAFIEALASTRSLIFGSALLAALPFLIHFVRRRLRTFVRAQTDRREDHPQLTAGAKAVTALAAVASAAILPIWLRLAGFWIEALPLPANLGRLGGILIEHLAVFAFLWFVTRSYLRPMGIGEALFGLRNDTRIALRFSARLLSIGYLSCLVPWVLLRQPPFQFTAAPRLAYTLFSLVVVVCVFTLFRIGSPLVRDLSGGDEKRSKGLVSWKSWPLISFLLLTSSVATLALDVVGYRFIAAALTRSLLLSIGTTVALVIVYRAIAPFIQIRGKRRAATAPGERPEASRKEVRENLLGFLRTMLFLIGAFAIAEFWGLNAQALGVLDGFTVLDIGPKGISIADILVCALSIAVTAWLVRNLATIYEMMLFPHFEMDGGLRYAVVTISRYVVFFVGLGVGLSALNIELGQLGWLVAAMGVGLGFGLQEIVSNFVCGLILLVERPVRVGDVVSVDTVNGRVARINIRSTTVMNWDQQEVVIPNRDLITKQVTNWTLSSKLCRLNVPIGVAYGSDIKHIKSLLLEVAAKHKLILGNPPPQALFLAHGDSSLDFELRVHLADVADKVTMQDVLNSEINESLAKHGVEIPFPQRDIHVRSGSLASPSPQSEDSVSVSNPNPKPRAQ